MCFAARSGRGMAITDAPWWKKLGWLLLIWAAGVVALGVVAGLIRLAMSAADLTLDFPHHSPASRLPQLAVADQDPYRADLGRQHPGAALGLRRSLAFAHLRSMRERFVAEIQRYGEATQNSNARFTAPSPKTRPSPPGPNRTAQRPVRQTSHGTATSATERPRGNVDESKHGQEPSFRMCRWGLVKPALAARPKSRPSST